MRTFFFVVNFTVGMLFTVGCVVGLIRGNSLIAFIGGIVILPMCAALTAAEWVAYYRQRRDLEKTLGVWCLILAGFGAFGVVTNASKVMQGGMTADLRVILPVGLAVTVYFGLCGAWRIRAATEPQP